MIGRLGGVICLSVAVPSQHIPEVGPRVDVAYNFVDNVKISSAVVSTVMAFLVVHLRV